MRFLEQSAEIFKQLKCDKESIDKHIEKCARICYKSENLIKEGSATSFVQRMIGRKHYAMLEHATIYLKLVIGSPIIDDDSELVKLRDFFLKNHYSRVRKIKYKTNDEAFFSDPDANDFISKNNCPCNVYYVSTNYRVIIENGLEGTCMKYICDYSDHHVKRVTVHVVTDRGVWNESIRHRALERIDDTDFDIIVDTNTEKEFSFAQESSRFCNYSHEKFNHELTFVIPNWCDREIIYQGFWGRCKRLFKKSTATDTWLKDMKKTEKNYFKILSYGLNPQDARSVLNNSLKTEMVMTGFCDSTGWGHFFNLRLKGVTGKPQPEMQTLAEKIYTKMEEL